MVTIPYNQGDYKTLSGELLNVTVAFYPTVLEIIRVEG